MRVTIKDIARLAGVSHSTVSRALNSHPAIPAKTAQKIQQLALELGYLPSSAARELRTNQSHALGVVVSRIDDPYLGEILQGIEDVLQNTGYSLFVASSHYDLESEKNIIRAFGTHRVDGVIVCSVPISQEHARQLETYGLPIVVINNQSQDDYPHSISHDDLYGSRQVVSHLIELGHCRIAYLGSRQASRTNLDRLRGYELELDRAGISQADRTVIILPGSEMEDGAAGAQEILSAAQRPTAVFCFNDLMAAGLMHALSLAGMEVPGQISVAGFDNIPYSAFTCPALTTYDQPKREIGSEAARMMLRLLDSAGQAGAAEPEVQTIKGRLLIRQSSAPPIKYHS